MAEFAILAPAPRSNRRSTPLDNVFTEEPAEAAARAAQDAAPTTYTEWVVEPPAMRTTISKLVAAEVTLGSHLAEQLAVAFFSNPRSA